MTSLLLFGGRWWSKKAPSQLRFGLQSLNAVKTQSVGIGTGSSFEEENDGGVLEIWALKNWFWVYLKKVC
ncbi:hypothetical protein K7X08_009267 [Anisodus acutangulus]|uniref:Uncharacterized protein n=1 Tax=Anisodus acutangulus TaxID=402998 RepID=A0A9Q1N0J2_9SOLA|nr:hypothetical protein K7X08_009267 [Anisodus acutangulus]